MTVLAAIDDSAAAGPVLDVARRVAALFGTHVEGVHVQAGDSGESAIAIAEAARIELHLRSGDVAAALRSEAETCDAMAIVVGTRGLPAGPTPAGHVTLDLVESLDRPVVVVPPAATDRPLRRVLVAVEGDTESPALRALLEQLRDPSTPEIVVVHIVEPSALPPFADSPVHEADAFARELKARVSSTVPGDSSRVHIEMRVGDPAQELREAARALDVDLVVMAWHRNLTGGHGRLVRHMLVGSEVPLVLIPLDRAVEAG